MSEHPHLDRRLAQVGIDALPVQIEGAVQTLPATRLSDRAFADGWTRLESVWSMPKGSSARMAWFDTLSILSDTEYQTAVTWALRKGDHRPRPSQLLEVGLAGRKTGKADPWAGHQIFRCAGCGYTHVSEERTDDPLRYCRRCADNRYDPDSSW